MNNIDIISFDATKGCLWGAGKSITAQHNLKSIIEATKSLLDSEQGAIVFLGKDLVIKEEDVENAMQNSQSSGIWYDERVAYSSTVPRVTQLLSPGIYFNLSLTSSGFSIWNISLQCLVVRKEIIRSVGFLNPSFLTVEGAMIDWIYRLLYGGALLERAELLQGNFIQPRTLKQMPVADEFRYIKNRLGKKWLMWSFFRYTLGKLVSLSEAWKSFHLVKNEGIIKAPKPLKHSNWRKASLQENYYKISIIIPTVERYPYLVTALNQLLLQTILPFEVIIIDQTPPEDRKPELFVGYEKIGLRYFSMDKSGQCGSRNLGLLKSSGDYILFIDDDVEVKPDLLEQHMRCIEYFNADVSCGVCDEVDAGPIPYDYTFIRHSDVFPTNNGMVKRSALEKSGLFDLAFDHGQRADGDIGARVYKAGAKLILNPEIRVLHHRAPRGGLRKHNVRKVTYSSSRKYITHFRMPHVTELYLNKRHFSVREQQEYILLSLLGMFSIRGNILKRALKVCYAFIMMAFVKREIRKRGRAAIEMFNEYPQIPQLK
ncbi:MAG: glycosyltransferase family A protein [Cyclobacteriaceae bacterium]